MVALGQFSSFYLLTELWLSRSGGCSPSGGSLSSHYCKLNYSVDYSVNYSVSYSVNFSVSNVNYNVKYTINNNVN